MGATKDLVGLHYDGSTSPPEGIGADQHNTPGTAAEVRPYIEDNYGLVGYSDASWRSKLNEHFSDAVHYVRHEYDHGRIRLVFATTDKQRADGFTKPLESAAFDKWRRHIISAHPPV